MFIILLLYKDKILVYEIISRYIGLSNNLKFYNLQLIIIVVF